MLEVFKVFMEKRSDHIVFKPQRKKILPRAKENGLFMVLNLLWLH